MVCRRGLLGVAYRRASTGVGWSLQVLRTPLGFDLAAPFAFSDRTDLSCWTTQGAAGPSVSSRKVSVAASRSRHTTFWFAKIPRHRVRIGYGDSLNPAYRCQPLALLCIVGVLLQARLVEFCVEYRTGLPDLKVLYRHSLGHDLTQSNVSRAFLIRIDLVSRLQLS